MKIGIIGLGDIAQKGYLPILHKKDVELHLHTRTEETLRTIGRQYRIENCHVSLESLLQSGIRAAFVHAPTDAHAYLIERLLFAGIHVHVDKPITYDLTSTARLVAFAEKKGLLLNVGFNRRFAPAYRQLREVSHPNMVLMQKNRHHLPGHIRKFVFDDFIHVVDTLLSVFPYDIDQITVSGRKTGGLLYHAVVQLVADHGATAIGIMNRDAGTTEESVAIFSAEEKRSVHNFSDVVIHGRDQEIRTEKMDWETTLHRRGFEQMIDAFLLHVSSESPVAHQQDALLTHSICEQIVEKLENKKETA